MPRNLPEHTVVNQQSLMGKTACGEGDTGEPLLIFVHTKNWLFGLCGCVYDHTVVKDDVKM